MAGTLEGLNKEQKEAVSHGEGPLLIVAGAGTGKTTVITRRIAHLIEHSIKPEEILAMAFGDKAAAEMEERVDQLLPVGYFNLQISTFHAFGERLLKEYGLAIGLPEFRVASEAAQWLLIRNNLDKFDLDYYRPLGNPTRFIKALVTHFSRCKDELITPEEYLEYAEKLELNQDSAEAGSNLSRTPSKSPPISSAEADGAGGEIKRVMEVANAYHVYQRLLLQNNSLDFGDLINYSLRLLQKRPQILKKLQNQYKFILIDEFQDTNFAQYELVKLLAEGHGNLTVVGDDDQSIFKFRGASISNILHFKKDYPKAKFISLTENYRSGQAILDKAHEFIRQNDPDRLEVALGINKKLKSNIATKGLLKVLEAPDFTAEAETVVKTIVDLMNKDAKLTLNDFAVLARSHDALEPFVAALEQNAVPHIYFANRGLYHKPIILDLLAYFKLLDNYHESAAMYRVLKFPVWGIPERALIDLTHFAKKKTLSLYEALEQGGKISGSAKILQIIEKHTKLARTVTVSQLFVEIIKDLAIEKLVATDDQKLFQNAKFLEAFHHKIQAFQNENTDAHLKTFVDSVNFEQEAGEQGKLEFDPEAGPEAVKLMTVHSAKGLEFQNVFVVGLVDKRFPSIDRAEQIEIPAALVKDILPKGDIHIEEERRLMYVAMTRAKENLFLTRAFDYGGKTTKKPSRFLIELGLAAEEKAKPTGKVTLLREKQEVILPVPKYFSFSQISTFKKCPLEYKYRYVLKLPEAGSHNLSFGLTIHKTFERYLKLFKDSATARDLFGEAKAPTLPDFSVLEKLYQESWVDDWFQSKGQKEEYKKRGLAMLKYFYEETKTRKPRIKFLEQSFRMRIKDGWFLGKIDRADESSDGLVIIDYKTGQSRGINKVDKDQLLTYEWAAQDFFHEKVADLQYWFLKDKLTVESFLGKPKELEKLKAEIDETAGEIVECVKQNSFDEADRRISHDCEYRDLEK